MCKDAAKIVCLVLAILGAIFTGLALLASVISGVLLATGVAAFANIVDGAVLDDIPEAAVFDNIADSILLFLASLAGIVILIIGIYYLIAFIFCVRLCNGICQRRPGQVKAYFIYGVTMTVLHVLIALGCVIINPVPSIVVLIECAIYCLYLWLVHHTYSILLAEAAPKYYIPHAGTQPQGPYYV